METKTQKKKNRIIICDGESEIELAGIETQVTLRAAQCAEEFLTGRRPQPYTRIRRPPRRERYVLIRNAQGSIIWNDVSIDESTKLYWWITEFCRPTRAQRGMLVQ